MWSSSSEMDHSMFESVHLILSSNHFKDGGLDCVTCTWIIYWNDDHTFPWMTIHWSLLSLVDTFHIRMLVIWFMNIQIYCTEYWQRYMIVMLDNIVDCIMIVYIIQHQQRAVKSGWGFKLPKGTIYFKWAMSSLLWVFEGKLIVISHHTYIFPQMDCGLTTYCQQGTHITLGNPILLHWFAISFHPGCNPPGLNT